MAQSLLSGLVRLSRRAVVLLPAAEMEPMAAGQQVEVLPFAPAAPLVVRVAAAFPAGEPRPALFPGAGAFSAGLLQSRMPAPPAAPEPPKQRVLNHGCTAQPG